MEWSFGEQAHAVPRIQDRQEGLPCGGGVTMTLNLKQTHSAYDGGGIP